MHKIDFSSATFMYFTSVVKITFFKRLYHMEKAWEPIHTFMCVQTVSLFLIKKILAALIL